VSKSSSNSDSHEIKQALAEQRKRLKVGLWRSRTERRVPELGFVFPVCPYCDEPITHINWCAMHEWLIKRSDLPVKLQVVIMHEYNCVLAHFQCHADHGQTREFKLRCARAQYKRYGRDTIATWVRSLGLKQSVEIPLESEEGAEAPSRKES
jgi:hypothetical protein